MIYLGLTNKQIYSTKEMKLNPRRLTTIHKPFGVQITKMV